MGRRSAPHAWVPILAKWVSLCPADSLPHCTVRSYGASHPGSSAPMSVWQDAKGAVRVLAWGPSRPLGTWLRRIPRPQAKFVRAQGAGNQWAIEGVASALRLGENGPLWWASSSASPPNTIPYGMKGLSFSLCTWRCSSLLFQPHHSVKSPKERRDTCLSSS